MGNEHIIGAYDTFLFYHGCKTKSLSLFYGVVLEGGLFEQRCKTIELLISCHINEVGLLIPGDS